MKISWLVVDSSNVPITGGAASTTIKACRLTDGYMLDWNDLAFKNAGWGAVSTTLSELDVTNRAGYYGKTIDISAWNDGNYQIMTKYTGTPKQNGDYETLIMNGKEATLSDQIYITGAIVADAGNSANQFKTNLTESNDNAHKNAWVRFTSGARLNELGKISSYNGTTKFIALTASLTGAPSALDTFELINK